MLRRNFVLLKQEKCLQFGIAIIQPHRSTIQFNKQSLGGNLLVVNGSGVTVSNLY